jgi:hypothetical protein
MQSTRLLTNAKVIVLKIITVKHAIPIAYQACLPMRNVHFVRNCRHLEENAIYVMDTVRVVEMASVNVMLAILHPGTASNAV